MVDTSHLDSAGTGSPVPAESSVELQRIRRRFTELSPADAEEGMRRARPLLDHLCGELGHAPAPDLGPAVIPDQLTVLVHDAYLGGVGEGVLEGLVELRRSL